MLRSKDELKRYMREHQQFLDFTVEALCYFLDYEDAEEYLKPELTEDQWKQHIIPYTEEHVTQTLTDYMNEYGFDKALNHRGLSASRTIDKIRAWCFALGKDELVAYMDDTENHYAQYGAPMLSVVAKHFGIPEPQSEDWNRMRQGLPCEPGCERGCET